MLGRFVIALPVASTALALAANVSPRGRLPAPRPTAKEVSPQMGSS